MRIQIIPNINTKTIKKQQIPKLKRAKNVYLVFYAFKYNRKFKFSTYTVSQKWSQPIIFSARDFFVWLIMSQPYLHENDGGSIICLGFWGFLNTHLGE